jgi:hypothetical protein
MRSCARPGLIAVVATAILFAQGCQVAPPEPPPQPIPVTGKKPVFTAIDTEKNAETQVKGGIKISIAPVAYDAVAEVAKSEPIVLGDQVTQEFDYANGIERRTPVQVIQYTASPVMTVKPKELRFTIKVNNQLSRVFRGQGIVVQFNVNNKLQSVAQVGYQDLQNMIVPPRGEADVEIYGPLVSTIPENATIGLYIYDVVTKTDAAGNVTEKQNFEWFYKYTTTAVQKMAMPGKVVTERKPTGPATIIKH